MNRRIPSIAFGLGVALCLACGSAEAQYGPSSSAGGDAARQLRNLYAQSIGQGYTADSIMRLQQTRDMVRVPPVGGLDSGLSTVRGRANSNIGSGISGSGLVAPSSKPFSSYSPMPTVSPYMNLFREDLGGVDDFNYQTLVRPQIQQREFNEKVTRDIYQSQRRLQSIAAQSDFNIQGSRAMPATGHATTFMNHSHFYPMQRRR